MSFRYSDLVIDLSDFARPEQRCDAQSDFCPTHSATAGFTEPAPLNLEVLRDQLRAALGH